MMVQQLSLQARKLNSKAFFVPAVCPLLLRARAAPKHVKAAPQPRCYSSASPTAYVIACVLRFQCSAAVCEPCDTFHLPAPTSLCQQLCVEAAASCQHHTPTQGWPHLTLLGTEEGLRANRWAQCGWHHNATLAARLHPLDAKLKACKRVVGGGVCYTRRHICSNHEWQCLQCRS
jgi:hypothetical protein